MTGGIMLRRSCVFVFLSFLPLQPLTLHSQPPITRCLWKYFTGPAQVQSPAVGPDGTIYIGSGRYNETLPSDGLFAVKPGGTQQWTLTLGMTVHSSVALDQEGNLYFIAGDANKPDSMGAALYSLDASGNLRWKLDSIGWMAPIPNTGFTPAIATDGTIYVCGRFSLFAVRRDGTVRWKHDFPLFDNIFGSGERHTAGNHRSAPTIASDGTVYVNTMRGGHEGGEQVEGGVYAFDSLGNVKWRTYDMGGTAAPVIGGDGTIYSAIGGYGVVTDTSNAPRLLAIRPDGTRKWAVETQLWCEASPSIGADGTLYIGTTHHPLDVPGWFHAISPEGQIKWTYDTAPDVKNDSASQVNPPDIYDSPVIDANGLIYFGNEAGRFYAMNPDGTVAWLDLVTSQKYGSPAIANDGTIYIPSDTKVDFDHYALIALQGGGGGLADSPWPKFRQNNANTGQAPVSAPTAVVRRTAPLHGIELFPNYPDPFNPTTHIRFQISDFRYLKLGVYDLLGRAVAMLVNSVEGPGTYTVEFDGSHLASGMYLCRLSAGDFTQVRKLCLLR
ncbi:MAG TPA: T9SS type A sorting domain-containing protein [Bacteroidota bacterium]|nr:T9SS type A sorting domain-containing protein [Bacteroidota bacterium]